MAVALGKRKRRTDVVAPPRKAEKVVQQAEESDHEDLRDAFRRAFEAKFRPLKGEKNSASDGYRERKGKGLAKVNGNAVEDLRDDEEESELGDEEEDESDSEDGSDDFEGLSEDGADLAGEPVSSIQVVDHTNTIGHDEQVSRQELKAFMVC